jgi:hypothetical protein
LEELVFPDFEEAQVLPEAVQTLPLVEEINEIPVQTGPVDQESVPAQLTDISEEPDLFDTGGLVVLEGSILQEGLVSEAVPAQAPQSTVDFGAAADLAGEETDLAKMNSLVVLESMYDEAAQKSLEASWNGNSLDEMAALVTLDFTGEEASSGAVREAEGILDNVSGFTSFPEVVIDMSPALDVVLDDTPSQNLVENVYWKLQTEGQEESEPYNVVAKTGIVEEESLFGNILKNPAVTVTPIPVMLQQSVQAAQAQPVVPCDASSLVVICFEP